MINKKYEIRTKMSAGSNIGKFINSINEKFSEIYILELIKLFIKHENNYLKK